MDYTEAIDYIYSKGFFTVNLGLDRINSLCSSLDNPQDDYKVIHIAGTNGKGSVTSFVSQILIEQGYSVGVYTSPHLVDFRERIRVDNELIQEQELADLVEHIKPFVKDHTFFEIVTAIAFMHFSRKKVDFVVLEVGLGGRLDATNVVNPILSVITNISLEHADHLGDTIEQISREKAGIIKDGIPVITGAQNSALKVIEDVAKEHNSRVIHVDEWDNLEEFMDNDDKISLDGEFQKINAAIAVSTVKNLSEEGFTIDGISILKGLKNARWPGRFEFVEGDILLDCAHNPAGMKNLSEEISKKGYIKDDVVFVFAAMKDKDISSMAVEVDRMSEDVVLTEIDLHRSETTEGLRDIFHSSTSILNIVLEKDVSEAIVCARKIKYEKKKKLIIVAGSIFLIGNVYSSLGLEPFDSSID